MKILACLACCVQLLSFAHADVVIKAQPDSLIISANAGESSMALAYPILVTATKDKYLKPIAVAVTDDKNVGLDFEGGRHIQLTADAASGTITLAGTNIGSDIKYVEVRANLPLSLKGTTKWQFGAAAAQLFPEDPSAKPHLYQGNASPFSLYAADGKGLSVTPPEFSYQELNDQRALGTQSFQWMTLVNYALSITVHVAESTAK